MSVAVKPKLKIEFRSEFMAGDTYGIRIYYDDKPGPWVQWCDRAAKKVCTSHGIQSEDGTITPVGWAGSKMQSEAGAEQLQHLYEIGEIK